MKQLSKKHRQKQTAVPRPLVKREILFPFGPTTSERGEALGAIYAELRQPVYSTLAEMVVSPDRQQTKITLWCDTAQENFLQSFLRQAPGTRVISEEDPVEEMAQLIRQYHSNCWTKLSFPHEEMRLSALLTGLGSRLAALDYPTFRERSQLWRIAEDCYRAVEATELFAPLLPCAAMAEYSFVGGHLAAQGTWEGETREANARMKREVLSLEEKGRPDRYIISWMEHMRDRLLSSGYRNAKDFIEQG